VFTVRFALERRGDDTTIRRFHGAPSAHNTFSLCDFVSFVFFVNSAEGATVGHVVSSFRRVVHPAEGRKAPKAP